MGKKKIKNKLDEECLNYVKQECGKWKVYKIKEMKKPRKGEHRSWNKLRMVE